MSKSVVQRQNLIQSINTLSDDQLIELANFLDYLQYKSLQQQTPAPPQQNFLLTIAGLGQSGQSTVSESDEEILGNEIDPIYGWSHNPENQL
jgi:hypothetical protein